MNINDLLTDEKIDSLMQQFDLDGDKEITRDEIKRAFTKFGKMLSESEINEIMAKHDLNDDGVISRDEFV